MTTERITIDTARGYTLSGALELPAGSVRGAALFAHCFTCTKQSKAAIAVARTLAEEGIATLRFDFTGLGGSGGDFGRAGFATDVADLVVTARYLAERFGGPVLLVGHSLGGAAVLSAVDDIGEERIAAVATIGAPADVPHVLQRIDGDLAAIRKNGEGLVSIGGQPFRIGREFLERVEKADLLTEVRKLRCPLMLLHAPTDALVGVENAGELFQAARHPKSFVSLDGANHLLTDEVQARFAANMIATWASRYLPEGADDLPSDGVTVRTGHGKFGTEILTPSHSFVADEPLGYGGADAGPTPYDLLLAALGSCTAMTMKMYAERKGWPFEGTTIRLTHHRDHHVDCDHCEEEDAKIQAIERAISLAGNELTAEQRVKLFEIADRCPVHRTIEGNLHIHTVSGEVSG